MKYKLSKLAGKMAEEGYNQNELGTRLKRSRGYVGERMRGIRFFDMKDVYTICDLLHIPYSEIIEYFPNIS